MSWTVERDENGTPTSLVYSHGDIQYENGAFRSALGARFTRMDLAAVADAERTLLRAWPDREPTAEQVGRLTRLQPGTVEFIWEHVGRVK